MSVVASAGLSRARRILERASRLSEAELGSLAVELAEALLVASQAVMTEAERRQRARLSAMMDDPAGQAFSTALTDRVHRSQDGRRLVSQVEQLLSRYGVPRSLPRLDQLELRALRAFGAAIPQLTARAVRHRIFQEARPYIVPAEAEGFGGYLKQRAAEGVRVNVNHLGEEVLGEAQAAEMIDAYVRLLEHPAISTISVKISSIYSQINLLAFQRTLEELCERLRPIYRAALSSGTASAAPAGAGSQAPSSKHKLVYLDMESYRDLELTTRVFRRLLDEAEFSELTAGIVLQAYIPESASLQRELTRWAIARVKARKAPIRMRLVKGANLGMERVIASLHGWEVPVYPNKHAVDANFKRMLRFGMIPAHAAAVNLGVGSHNLFDLAYALLLRRSRGVEQQVELEMLEGMADAERRVVQELAGGILLYAPSVDERNFDSAVAYLVRRLDENTSEENFLRASFGMKPNSRSFRQEAEKFLRALADVDQVSDRPRRQQDRAALAAGERASLVTRQTGRFQNEPDTDFTRPANRDFLCERLRWAESTTFDVSLQIAGKDARGQWQALGFDPSRPGYVPYQYQKAGLEQIEQALSCARTATWGESSVQERIFVLRRIAEGLRRARGELIALMVLDAGKRVEEADIEVSEAIDFAEYYAHRYALLCEHYQTEPLGTVLVTPPWNFPLAIPLSGTLAALVAGNRVILKPAPETILVAFEAAKICWEAGVPRTALQFLVCDDELGSHLIRDPRVDAVVLTGATQTARLFLRLRPGLTLFAETGGKNAMIVGAVSDREQAIADLVRSVFGHSGQKCSACSLLILEAEVFEDCRFQRQLADVVSSLKVGSAWDLESFVTPLIRPPSAELRRGLERLEAGERWLIEPRVSEQNERLVSPGVRWGVTPGSFCHLTELFGPVLSVLCARDLKQAIEFANASAYGLTAGLHSLDERQQELFLDSMDSGNLYLNRGITGAVVGRQPFGGRKASGFGPGAKAGGPNYVSQFCRLSRRARVATPSPLTAGSGRKPCSVFRQGKFMSKHAPGTSDLSAFREVLDKPAWSKLKARLKSYNDAALAEFLVAHPLDALVGQDNVFRYQPCSTLLVWGEGTEALDAVSVLVATQLLGIAASVLAHVSLPREWFEGVRGDTARFTHVGEVIEIVDRNSPERLRWLGHFDEELWVLLQRHALYIARDDVSDEGYLELRRYVKEQSVSDTYHRHGNLSFHEVERERGVRSIQGEGIGRARQLLSVEAPELTLVPSVYKDDVR